MKSTGCMRYFGSSFWLEGYCCSGTGWPEGVCSSSLPGSKRIHPQQMRWYLQVSKCYGSEAWHITCSDYVSNVPRVHA
eukprot:6172343-Pleurochrysis_carterae.AAC.4